MNITITTKHILIVFGVLFLAVIACMPIAMVMAYPAAQAAASDIAVCDWDVAHHARGQ